MQTKTKHKIYSVLIVLAIVAITLAVSYEPEIRSGGLSEQEQKMKKFTDNLEDINYSKIGQKDAKGIWQPTEKEIEEVYKYVYGDEMVNWQLPDGTPMCGTGKEATNCVPHWKQEYENAKFNGELYKIRENEINGDKYDEELVGERKFDIIGFLKRLIMGANAGVEFSEDMDPCGGVLGVTLADQTPDTGTGWGIVTQNGNGTIRCYGSPCVAEPYGMTTSEGTLYGTQDTMSNADYTVSVSQINGDNSDDTNSICCRLADANNMYCVRFNEADADLYINDAGSWSTIDTQTSGIADGSTLELICEGTSISVEDDDSEILSATDSTHSSAGLAGMGMGAIMVASDDGSSQELDDFAVTVTGSSPSSDLFSPNIIIFD